MDLPFHPAAAIFPLLEDEELDELVASIKANGLRETIKTHDGKILDGRNRMTACRIAGVPPRFEPAKVNGSVADYVYDMNYHRRQLSEGAKQLAAGRYKTEKAAEDAKARQREAGKQHGRGQEKVVAKSPPPINAGKARDDAGKKFGMGGKTVDAAAKVLKEGAKEVIKAVERGELKVSTAARLVEAPKSVQTAAVKEGKAAVRQAIEKHTPTPNEVSSNDAGVRWHKAMYEIRSRLSATRAAGGIKQLVKRWTDAQRKQYIADLEEFIEEFQTWLQALKAK